jgi:hypothetical protein
MSGLGRGSRNLDRGLDNVWPPSGPGKRLERAHELWDRTDGQQTATWSSGFKPSLKYGRTASVRLLR